MEGTACLLHVEGEGNRRSRGGCTACCSPKPPVCLPCPRPPPPPQRQLQGKGVGKDAEWAGVLREPLFAGASDGGSASLGHLLDLWVERQHLLWKVRGCGLLAG